MNARRVLTGLLVVAVSCACFAAAPAAGASGHLARAIVVSVDGMHALDLARYVRENPESTLAALSRGGVTYTNARTPFVGDSTPGLVSLATGGTPAVHGMIYSPMYDRALLPPGKGTTPGSVYYIDEKWVKDMTREDSGGGIDPEKLPRDAKSGTPVYPHQLMRVNTMFEVVHEAGGRTAWIDQHDMYNDFLRGPSGLGLDDSRALERKGTPQTFEGMSAQDDRRVEMLLRQLGGRDSRGRDSVGVPRLFGMGFIAFGAQQKSVGYSDGDGALAMEN
jgi:hypothetical protein